MFARNEKNDIYTTRVSNIVNPAMAVLVLKRLAKTKHQPGYSLLSNQVKSRVNKASRYKTSGNEHAIVESPGNEKLENCT